MRRDFCENCPWPGAPQRGGRTGRGRCGLAGDAGGEGADLVWLTAAPGAEEQVLAGIRDGLGAGAPVVGGSAADNDVSGGWAQFDRSGARGDAVVVSVLFPSAPVARAHQSGHAPTATRGRVTRVAGVPFHLLEHPAVAEAGGGLTLFADVAPGEDLWQMEGSADSLVARAGRVAAESRAGLAAAGGAQGDGPSGALVVYRGGCMLAVQERMEEVAQAVRDALGGAPFLGVFTFGEQGAPLGRRDTARQPDDLLLGLRLTAVRRARHA